MSTGFQSTQAGGTKGECRPGKVRHTVTLDRALFEAIRASAIANNCSVSEEMASRLQIREVPLANPSC